jgi:phenylacetate-CoA ligase
MTLRVETNAGDAGLADRIGETLQAITKLKGKVELAPAGTLPNDGKVIADERSYK